jgi:hypothetical protein
MIMWLFAGMAIVLGLLYFHVINVPTTGFFIDIPEKVQPAIQQMGEPYIILFWVVVGLIIAIILLNQRGK